MNQHKLRTLLTLLGLIVGISSVLVMTGIARGFSLMAQEDLASLLPNKISVRQGFSPDAPPTPLTLREVALLEKMIGQGTITAVAPSTQLWDLQIKGVEPDFGGVLVTATTADYLDTVQLDFVQGRFFTVEEERDLQLVAVLSQNTVELLQQSGQSDLSAIQIDNKPFRIVGITESVGGRFSMPQIYIPINLLQREINTQSVNTENGSLVVEEIVVMAQDVDHLEQAKRAIERTLRLRYGLTAEQGNSFAIQDEGDILGFAQDFMLGFTLVLGGIGAVALVVGGIGIMNILLASISERTREIGLRKAIGANNLDILAQFLIEAITICLAGGILGVGFSYGVGAIINFFTGGGDSMIGLRVVIDLRSVIIAAVSSTLCGIVFGLYPALRAMRLNPIEALRTS